MLCYVFRLRLDGARLDPADILDQPVPHGWLIHNPPHHPLGSPRTDTWLVDPNDRAKEVMQRLEHSELKRLDGVLLFRGFEPCPGRSGYRQTWLCSADFEVGVETVQLLPVRR